MGIQMQLENGSLLGGGLAAFKGANVHGKPLDYGTLGHYRVVASLPLVVSQAANSRLFELRNAGSNLIVPTLIEVEAIAYGDVTPDALLWLSMFGCTNFTAVDSVNVATPTAMVVRPTGMTGAPGGAQIRSVVGTGAAAGMTGGTLTKDSGAHSALVTMISSASADRPSRVKRFVCPMEQATHPPVYAANQGLVIEHVGVGSVTANEMLVLLTVAWAEVTVY